MPTSRFTGYATRSGTPPPRPRSGITAGRAALRRTRRCLPRWWRSFPSGRSWRACVELDRMPSMGDHPGERQDGVPKEDVTMNLTDRQRDLLMALARAVNDGADLVLLSIDPDGSGP